MPLPDKIDDSVLKHNNIFLNIAYEYNKSLAKYGYSSRGVMWSKDEAQRIRFDILSSVIKPKNDLSINDFGCGCGAFFDYLSEKKLLLNKYNYYGYDISIEMLNELRRKNQNNSFVHTILNNELKTVADYSFVSGTFNLKLSTPDAEWEKIVQNMIINMDSFSKIGFAFNLLSYANEKKYASLFYAKAENFFEFVKQNIKGDIKIFSDYLPDDFTITVTK